MDRGSEGLSEVQVLNNQTLLGETLVRFLPKGGGIWNPTGWEFFLAPGTTDENAPQSRRRDDGGYGIDYGWMEYTAGYIQRQVAARANQRYLNKAILTFHYSSTDKTFKPDNIEARVGIEGENGAKIFGAWENCEPKHRELLFPWQPTRSGKVNFILEVHSRYKTHACTIQVHSLEMFEVAADYGGDKVAMIAPYGATQEVPPVVTPPLTLPNNPVANDPRWQPIMVRPKNSGTAIPVRKLPLSTMGTAEFLVSNAQVKYLPQERWDGWWPVQLVTGLIGWIADASVDFVQIPETPATPGEVPPDLADRMAKLWARMAEINKARAELAGQEQAAWQEFHDIQVEIATVFAGKALA